MSDDIKVVNNAAQNRYEVEIDGARAVLEYRDVRGVRYYTHTEVPEALEGRGIASKMARTVLDEAQAQQLTIVAMCPFVRGYLERHPEYQPLVKQ